MKENLSRHELEEQMFSAVNIDRQHLLKALGEMKKFGLHRDYLDLNTRENPARGYCLVVSNWVCSLPSLKGLGAKAFKISEEIVGRDEDGCDEPQYHVFVRLADGRAVDLTASQFTDAQFERVRAHYDDEDLISAPRFKKTENAAEKLDKLMGSKSCGKEE